MKLKPSTALYQRQRICFHQKRTAFGVYLFSSLFYVADNFIWFPGDNVTIFLGVDEGGGGVATVIVGLSFAVKIPSGKIRIYPCVVTALQEPQ